MCYLIRIVLSLMLLAHGSLSFAGHQVFEEGKWFVEYPPWGALLRTYKVTAVSTPGEGARSSNGAAVGQAQNSTIYIARLETYDGIFDPEVRKTMAPGIAQQTATMVELIHRGEYALIEEYESVGIIPPGNKAIAASQLEESSMFKGRNSIVMVSDTPDFKKIIAMYRVAKTSAQYPLLPIERRLARAGLKPFPRRPLREVDPRTLRQFALFDDVNGNRFSSPQFGVSEMGGPMHYTPYGQFFDGDIVEMKHYLVRDKSRSAFLTAVMFHELERGRMLPFSRVTQYGERFGFREDIVFVSPSTIVAETERPELARFLRGLGMTQSATVPDPDAPGHTAAVMTASRLAFAGGFRAWHQRNFLGRVSTYTYEDEQDNNNNACFRLAFGAP